MEGIQDIIKALESALDQLKAIAPEEKSEESDDAQDSGEGPKDQGKQDEDGADGSGSFKAKKPVMIAMLKKSLSK